MKKRQSRVASKNSASPRDGEVSIIIAFSYYLGNSQSSIEWWSHTYNEPPTYSQVNQDLKGASGDGDVPKPDAGYWIFSGWDGFDGVSSDTITESTTFYTTLTPAQIEIPINWDGAGNQSPVSPERLRCTWGEDYPRLTINPSEPTEIPQKQDASFLGAFLVQTNTDESIVQTNTVTGEGIGLVAQDALGRDTITTDEPIQITSCNIKVYFDVSIPDEDESIDGSDVVYPDCVINFIYKDSDGQDKIFDSTTVAYGTLYSSIANPEGYPKLTYGYWIFTGWSESFGSSTDTRQVTTSITSRANFEPALIQIKIEANGATNVDADATIQGKWGERYRNLADIPEKDGSVFAGAFLTNDSAKVVGRTHDSIGEGVTVIRESVLRADTTDDPKKLFDIPWCSILICWQEPVRWNTVSDLREAVGAIPCPFASDQSATVTIPNDDDSSDSDEEVSFKKGFPIAYTKPIIDPETGQVNSDARVITRRQVNTLGYIGTQEQFFAQCGGYYTFDEEICEAIGGYPESAILRLLDEENNCLRTVYSLMDDNTWNFITNGVDGVHWKYIDDCPTLSMRVDYSQFLDLSNILFVETGLPDFYEIPYDGMLQMHSLSFCDMSSTLRDDTEYISQVATGLEHDVDGYHPVYENIQGTYATAFTGQVFLDIYNVQTNTTTSCLIRNDGSMVFGASVWDLTMGKGGYYNYKMPRYVVTQGTFFLNKGDKIRVRGVYTDILSGESLGNPSRVFSQTYSDKDIRRFYLCKFANFYRMGWEV